MSLDYFRCELCGAQLLHSDETNAKKFPAARQFQDGDSRKQLLSVRCAECAHLPYRLEEGQPYRADLLTGDERVIIVDCNSYYGYFPHGIGHLLEIFLSSPAEGDMAAVRNRPLSLGFLVEEDVNLIVVAYGLESTGWNVTPYSWHACPDWARATPPINPSSEFECKFTTALVDTRGGSYRAVRAGIMPPDFATTFHQAIHDQIARGEPDKQRYNDRVRRLHELLSMSDRGLNVMLNAQCVIQ